ncbi:hypothetical protein N1851_010576 [Merluccius polli]|uniref:C17orf113 probable zinc finger domain-containing protein n=1 Tax=Merluccius polli TaxID=89951 RepID=A0AA47MZ69_MERPO|nr:hypothetical protein N1851_010576 [Merluccius polli]
MFCDICKRANMSNGFVRGCKNMQKSALTDHKSSHSHLEALRVLNQSVAMIKHVEKSQVACNEALKTQLKICLLCMMPPRLCIKSVHMSPLLITYTRTTRIPP